MPNGLYPVYISERLLWPTSAENSLQLPSRLTAAFDFEAAYLLQSCFKISDQAITKNI